MNLNVIQFQKDRKELIYRELTLENAIGLLTAQRELRAHAVWVMPELFLAELRCSTDVVIDRGTKNKAMELSRIFKDGDSINMVNGDFSSSGKLRMSIETFLSNLDGANPRLFIVGTTNIIFNKLREKAVCYSNTVEHREATATGCIKTGLAPLLPPDTFVDDDLRHAYLGNAPEVEEVRLLIVRAAKFNDIVLIMGDTGTGKEIVASEIHRQRTKLKKENFIAVNCGAFTRELFESELFGHEKGAFTGAITQKKGLWLAAEGGTLFLDEIGELALDLQAKVLRAIQENKVRAVGSEKEHAVNARIIAATNRDLYAMVQHGRFREDLYYRLRGYIIRTPALRDHRDDIPLLAQTIWKTLTGKNHSPLSESVINDLYSYSWPGNVRELKMVLTNLYCLFGNDMPITEERMRFVFESQGICRPFAKTENRTPEILSMEDYSAYRRLRITHSSIRAVEYLLKPALEKKPDAINNPDLPARLYFLLADLDSQCRHPLSFAPDTYEKINLLRSRLTYFIGELEENVDEACEYLRDACWQALEDAISATHAESDNLISCIKKSQAEIKKMSPSKEPEM